MVSDRTLLEILELDDRVTFDETASGGILNIPAGSRVHVTRLQLKILLAFKTPTSVLRASAMAASDEERTELANKLNDWIDLGILRASETHHGSVPLVTMTNTECSNIFFIYTGVQGGMMMNPLDFLQNSGLSNQNVVLLRDTSQTWFLNGCGDQISSSGELVAWLSGYLEGAVYIKHHYCMGSSMGAFPALVFGHMLKARAVWSFGLSRTKVPILNSQGEPWNLETILSRWNGVTRYYLYFNESSAGDREAASRLEELPGVELCPQSGEGHLVLNYLRSTGKLSDVFPRSISCKTATPSFVGKVIVGEHEVLEVLRDVVSRHRDVLDATTSLAGILDSFALVELLERLARDLGVELDPGRLCAADFENVASIARAIARESETP